MLRMCKTIDVLAKMYSPNHPQRRKPPPLAIEHQSQSQECAKTEATPSNVQSAIQSPPSIVIPNVADVVKSGMKNLLAIATATEINFKEAETMKTALAEKPLLAKNGRGHVTGAQSTLSPAGAPGAPRAPLAPIAPIAPSSPKSSSTQPSASSFP